MTIGVFGEIKPYLLNIVYYLYVLHSLLTKHSSAGQTREPA